MERDPAVERLDWLRWRQGGLGASDIMQILLKDSERPYGGPWDVWESKTQTIGPDEGSESMALGNWLEKPIGEWVAHDLGRELRTAEPVQGAEAWMRCTPDFWLFDPQNGGIEGLECKLSGKGWMWRDGVPPFVHLQAMWCMMCTGTPVWNVGAYLPGEWKRGRWLIERNEDLEGEVVELARRWWETHVVEGKPPPVDGSKECSNALAKIYPEVKVAELIEADGDQCAMISELVDMAKTAKAHAARKRVIQNELAAAVGDNKGIKGARGSLTWYPKAGTTRLDSKTLKSAHPDIWKEFSVTGEPSRVARLVAAKEQK